MNEPNYEEFISPEILRDLRRRAREIIHGRVNWERERGPSAKPLTKVDVGPKNLLAILDEIDRLRQELADSEEEVARQYHEAQVAEAKLAKIHAFTDNADPHLDRWGNPDGYCVDQEDLLAILNDEEKS